MTTPDLTITATIPIKKILYLLCTACEQGCGYWLRWDRVKLPKNAPVVDVDSETFPPEDDYMAPFRGGALLFRELDGDGETPKTRLVLDLAAIQRGLALMAEKYGQHFGNFMSENDDAETADVFMQCALLGEIRYG